MTIPTLDVPSPVLLDASLSSDGATLHFAWEQYENPSPVVIDGVPTAVGWMLGGVAAYDANGNGVSVYGAFGMPNPDTELTIGTPPLTGVQTFVFGIVFYDASGNTLVGQAPHSNGITIDFGGVAVAPLAASAIKPHGKKHG